MTSLLLLARMVLAAVFGLAVAGKLLDPAGSRKSLTEFGVPGPAVTGELKRIRDGLGSAF